MGLGRKVQNVAKVPLKAEFGLKLRDQLMISTNPGRELICLPEMSILLSCLKNSNFIEESCQAEITGFQKCYNSYKAASEAKRSKKIDKAGVEDIQKLLKKYPTK